MFVCNWSGVNGVHKKARSIPKQSHNLVLNAEIIHWASPRCFAIHQRTNCVSTWSRNGHTLVGVWFAYFWSGSKAYIIPGCMLKGPAIFDIKGSAGTLKSTFKHQLNHCNQHILNFQPPSSLDTEPATDPSLSAKVFFTRIEYSHREIAPHFFPKIKFLQVLLFLHSPNVVLSDKSAKSRIS